MATVLAQQDEEIENALQLFYRCFIRMQELRVHIWATAQEIGVDPPTGRTRHAWQPGRTDTGSPSRRFRRIIVSVLKS
jgi:hypothetical protein